MTTASNHHAECAASEASFRELVENAAVWIWETDDHLRHVYTNRFVTRCLGYVPEEFLAADIEDLVHPDDREALRRTAREALEEHRDWLGMVLRWRHKDGSWRHIESAGRPVLNAEGRAVRLRGVDRDVTERVVAEEALRKSESRLRTLVDNAPFGAHLYHLEEDGSLVFTGANAAADRILRVDNAQFVGKTIEEAFPPLADTPIPDAYRNVACTGVPFEQVQVDYGDQEIRGAFEIHAFATGPNGMAVFFRDITEKARAEKTARRATEELDRFFAATPSLLCIADLQGVFRRLNPEWKRTLGYELDDLKGKRFIEFVHPDDREATEETTVRAATQEIVSFRNRYRRKDGTWRWLAWRAVPTGDSVYAAAQDVTEQVRAEEELRVSERNLAAIFELGPDPTTITEIETGRVVDLNGAAARLFGRSREETIGMTTAEINVWADYSDRGRMVELMKKKGEIYDLEVRLRNPEGEIRNALFSSRFVELGGKRVILSRVHDVTDLRQAEEARFELERRLLHAQKLESLGIMAGGIAHDFNNLLMAILGNLDLARAKLSPMSPALQNLDQALQASLRAADLTRQMLAYSGKGVFVVGPVDLNVLVAENVQLLRAAIPKNVGLELRTEPSLPAVQGDAAQLQQVVMNLITNAAEAIGDGGGTITVTAGVTQATAEDLQDSRIDEKPPPGLYAFLKVSDTGCGMDDETQSRLFDPFFSTKTVGRGLGMSAILGIVRGHRGAILVDSVPGRGTTVQVLLPLGAGTPETRSGEEVAAPERGGPEGPRPTVLLVDDEEMVRSVVAEILGALGMGVVPASSGDEALAVFRRDPGAIDVVLMDLSMPGMDGVVASREMLKLRKDALIVLASGYHEQEMAGRAEGENISAFLQKPYAVAALREVMGRVLGKRR